MALAPGTHLGPYEVIAPLGAGGMGEVYRAKDTRLGRDVAVKVLPQHLSTNPEVRARFEREARTVSTLNHPHICTLHDVGREGDTDYLVMELVEGETLAERLTRGALPVGEVLRLGAQIADALGRAHRAGVVHRDLKPGNVMLTKGGTGSLSVKLLDFGLARATGLAGPGGGSGRTQAALTQSPTLAAPLTAEGTIVGTFQYMAPEQLEGREADARVDLWALGCVLYEMATGKRAFEGGSQASLIASILKEQPKPLVEIVPLTPPALERAVNQCLAKDPDERWQTASDLRRELVWIAEAGASSSAASSVVAAAARMRPAAAASRAPMFGAIATLFAGAALLVGHLTRTDSVDVAGLRAVPFAFNADQPHWSPDGKAVAYSSDIFNRRRVSLRRVDSSAPTLLAAGPERMMAEGWSGDGSHVIISSYSTNPKDPILILRVSSAGGEPEPVMELDRQKTNAFAVSRDGKQLAAFVEGVGETLTVAISDPIGSPLKAYAPAPFATRSLVNAPALAFSPDGTQLLMSRDDQAGAQPWILPLPAGRQPPRRTLEHIQFASSSPEFSWMPDGRHVVVAFNASADDAYHLWYADTRSDALVQLTSGTHGESSPEVSPDGKSLLFNQGRSSSDIITLSLEDGSSQTLVQTGWWESLGAWARGAPLFSYTSDRNGIMEIWLRAADGAERPIVTKADFPAGTTTWFMNPSLSPDGTRVIFTRIAKDGKAELWLKSVAGGAPVRVTNQVLDGYASGWSPDGTRFAFLHITEGNLGLTVVKATGNATPEILKTRTGGGLPDWSPDGQWLTYADEKGLWHLISPDGKRERELGDFSSSYLAFSRDGRSLFGIRSAAGELSLIAYDLDTSTMRTIKALDKSLAPVTGLNPGRRYTLTPDGQSLTYSVRRNPISEIWLMPAFKAPRGAWGGWKWPGS